MGLVEKHTNFFTIFHMLRTFFHSFPEHQRDMVGITEADQGNSLYEMYISVGGTSIGVNSVPQWREKIQNTGKTYQSDIIVGESTVAHAIQKYSCGIREYLKANRPPKAKTPAPLLLAA